MRQIRLRFLGTGGSVATVERSMIGTMLSIGSHRMLVDCGSGIPRQMLRAGLGMNVDSVFFTHFHGDHTLGFADLVFNLSVTGRKEPLHVYGCEDIHEFMDAVEKINHLSGKGLDLRVHEVQPGDVLEFDGFSVKVFQTYHRIKSVGYRFEEAPRPGKFNVGLARRLGVPEGPLYGKLQNGEAVRFDAVEDGNRIIKTVGPELIVGPAQPGRIIVFTGDTKIRPELAAFIENADVWLSEGTYTREFGDLAEKYAHTCVGDAAALAASAGVKHLVFNHITARFSHDVAPLIKEASAHGDVTIPNDLDEVIL